MDHSEARRLAATAPERNLEPVEERDLALHLVSCGECKRFFDNVDGAMTALRAIASPPPREVVDTVVLRAIAVVRGQGDPGNGIGTAAQQQQQGQERDLRDDAGDETAGMPSLDPASRPGADEAGSTLAADAAVADPGAELWPPAETPDELSRGRARRWGRRRAEEDFKDEPAPDEGAPVVVGDDTETRARSGSGRWAIAAALGLLTVTGLAIAAVFLLTREPVPRPEPAGELPEAEAVRVNADRAFEAIESLDAGFTVTRLSWYRLPPEEGAKPRYTFSNGIHRGRVVYDSAEAKLREERSLKVPVRGTPETKTTIVRSAQEVRTLTEQGSDRKLVVESNFAPGPPDGPVPGRLGFLDSSVGSAVQMLASASEARVDKEATTDGRRSYLVSFPVRPDELTRADRIEMVLDAETWLPLRIRRFLNRKDAAVLGPEQYMTTQAVESAFGDDDRVTTETVALDHVAVDQFVLKGEFEIEASGAEEETRNGQYRALTRGELADELNPDPLLPTSLPGGFREESFAAYDGTPKVWGPRQSYPAAKQVFYAFYSNGKTQVSLSQRTLARGRIPIEASPLAVPGSLPVVERKVVAGASELTYAVSPEVVPHLYGYVGDTFVVVAGYTTEEDLVAIAGSLEGAPNGSPSASRRGSPTAEPEETPQDDQ